MLRNIIIVVCTMLLASESFAALQFITEILTRAYENITRVRTLEELNRRSGENVVLDFIGLIEQHDGYKAEEYEVRTQDGYILMVHRISGSPSSPKASGKPVVYFQHGLLGSSDFHVVLGPEQALPFYLADLGYDVWLGNVRGNTYSKRHIKYSNEGSNKEFWDFRLHEMGAIDVPAFIDTVLEKTNQTQLTYIGYSMGTSLSYIMLSTRPEYNDKINIVINMAPVVYFSPPYSLLIDTLLVNKVPIETLALANRVYQILPQSKLMNIVGKNVCGSVFGKILCEEFLSVLSNTKNLNDTILPTLLAYTPAGTSLNTLLHFYQIIKSGEFRNYSYGIMENIRKYGSSSPPSYDLSKVTAKQALFYSDADVFISVRDAMKLNSTLKNVVAFEEAPAKGFNHFDFILDVDARKIIYDPLIECLKTHA